MRNIISKFKGAPVQACHPADRENCLQRRPRCDVRHLCNLWTSSPLSYSKVKPKCKQKTSKTFNPLQNLTRGSELPQLRSFHGDSACHLRVSQGYLSSFFSINDIFESFKVVVLNVFFRFFYIVHADKGFVVGD